MTYTVSSGMLNSIIPYHCHTFGGPGLTWSNLWPTNIPAKQNVEVLSVVMWWQVWAVKLLLRTLACWRPGWSITRWRRTAKVRLLRWMPMMTPFHSRSRLLTPTQWLDLLEHHWQETGVYVCVCVSLCVSLGGGCKYNSTSVRFDCSSTILWPFDDIRYDHKPHAGLGALGVVRIDPLHFLAVCHKSGWARLCLSLSFVLLCVCSFVLFIRATFVYR